MSSVNFGDGSRYLTDAVQALLDAQGTAGVPTSNGAAAADEQDAEPPRRWADRATNEDWIDLVAWVDRLTCDYAIRSEFHVPPCWPTHAGVVEELAALHRAWISSARADHYAGTAGAVQLAVWHDQWLARRTAGRRR